jgi:membrane protein required for colicin V production
MPDIAVTDWVLLAVIVLSMALGAWRGLVYEVLSVLGWVLSFYLAQMFAPQVAGWLPFQTASAPVRFAAAFVLVFVAALFSCGMLSFLLKKMVAAIGLRPVDRTLGAAFGLVRAIVLLLVATVVMDMTALKESAWWRDSRGASVLTATLKGLQPLLPPPFARFLS